MSTQGFEFEAVMHRIHNQSALPWARNVAGDTRHRAMMAAPQDVYYDCRDGTGAATGRASREATYEAAYGVVEDLGPWIARRKVDAEISDAGRPRGRAARRRSDGGEGRR